MLPARGATFTHPGVALSTQSQDIQKLLQNTRSESRAIFRSKQALLNLVEVSGFGLAECTLQEASFCQPSRA